MTTWSGIRPGQDDAARVLGHSTPADAVDSARRVNAALAAVLATVALTVVGSWWMPTSWFLVATLLPLSVAAWIDHREHRLPDAWVLAGATPIVVAAGGWILAGRVDAATAVALGAVLFAGPLLTLHLVAPTSLGFGDVKAGAVLGGGGGLLSPGLALVALCVASGAAAVWGIARARTHVPMGPAFIVGSLAAFAGARVAGLEAPPWP